MYHLFVDSWFYLTFDRTLSGATTLCQSPPGSNCNEGVSHILQISNALLSDCLMPYPENLLEGD